MVFFLGIRCGVRCLRSISVRRRRERAVVLVALRPRLVWRVLRLLVVVLVWVLLVRVRVV